MALCSEIFFYFAEEYHPIDCRMSFDFFAECLAFFLQGIFSILLRNIFPFCQAMSLHLLKISFYLADECLCILLRDIVLIHEEYLSFLLSNVFAFFCGISLHFAGVYFSTFLRKVCGFCFGIFSHFAEEYHSIFPWDIFYFFQDNLLILLGNV